MNPPGGYVGGKVYVKFNKIETGVKLYISSSKIPETTITSGNSKTYSIANGEELLLTAVPSPNSFNTSFAFQYWTDGVEKKDAPIFKKIEAHKEALLSAGKEDSGSGMIIGIIIGLIVVIIAIVVIIIIRRKR